MNSLPRGAMVTDADKLAELRAYLLSYPCTCGPSYTERRLTAPDCFRHNAIEDVLYEMDHPEKPK